jgi:hypothetical protein
MKWGVALFLTLQACDVLGTLLLYYLSGTPDMEQNPLARYILTEAGGGGLAGLKAVGVVIIGACWLKLPGPWRLPMLGFSNLVMAGIVSWNTYLTMNLL